MGSQLSWLNHVGLTNRESEDLGVIASAAPRTTIGICYSFTCAGTNNHGAVKTYDTKKDYCTCGYRLVFKQILSSKLAKNNRESA